MKSVYYVAMVTRAYRKALDALEGKISPSEAQPFIDELENVSHRESTTGFYYNKADADETTIGASDSKFQLAAEVEKDGNIITARSMGYSIPFGLAIVEYLLGKEAKEKVIVGIEGKTEKK